MKAEAYIDGSYSGGTTYGAGAIIYIEGLDSPVEQKYQGSDSNMARMRNIAGEIAAACMVVNTCLKVGIDELVIHYDYAGIEYWVTGKYKTNKACTIAYKGLMQDAMKKMKISFVKVLAHSGVPGNERADQLAKEANKT